MNFQVTHLKPFGAIVEPKAQGASVKDLDLKALHQLFLQEQIVVLRGFTTFKNSEEFASYCETWGEISIWPFGKVLELVEQENPQDHIFDHSYVPMHWDGMYRPQVPEYQIFHCVKAPLSGHGGRTTFSNTVLALKNASPELKAFWGKVTGIYQREMEFYKSKTVSPIITKHPKRDFSVIRYNEPPSADKGHFVNPPDLEFAGVPVGELEAFHQGLKSALYAPENFYAHEWQDGDVVITDNFTLLHGREAFTSKSPRHLQRVQVQSSPPFDNPGLESYK
ncbi:TauD/TfdA family dioxygenase [Bdellovibrio bacteriovorus]|uniref:Pyoverdine biosynthesis protein PvcB n=1 Tax=Bdellovibrio bacteriovorus (strain ATCC 15356 / DSM 50701 / NCIMB 9529 / HD100) TaxID=264462 RepID=Q6MN11_BDEBA|nr:TauD/TfdA family dioxygenase [Bdellovibrio bacteriovorus]CAE79341.1 pyoverdine biosynthesis protein PvcB [Bdellovibrio bacteriovorus HD100]